MINLKVKSVWQGKVALRDKYIDKAILTNSDIMVECGAEYMKIPYKKIKKLEVKTKAPVYVKDKFEGRIHKLIYFDWKPMYKQESFL